MPMRTPWLLLFFAPFARGLAKDPQIAHIPPLNTCEPVNITWEYGTPPFDIYATIPGESQWSGLAHIIERNTTLRWTQWVVDMTARSFVQVWVKGMPKIDGEASAFTFVDTGNYTVSIWNGSTTCVDNSKTYPRPTSLPYTAIHDGLTGDDSPKPAKQRNGLQPIFIAPIVILSLAVAFGVALWIGHRRKRRARRDLAVEPRSAEADEAHSETPRQTGIAMRMQGGEHLPHSYGENAVPSSSAEHAAGPREDIPYIR